MEIKLYQYNDLVADVIERNTDPETGVFDEAAIGELDALELSHAEKLRSIVCLMKENKARIEQIKAIAKAEAERYKGMIASLERTNKHIGSYVWNCEGRNVKTDSGNITFRQTQATEVADDDAFIAWATEHGHNDLLTVNTKTTITPNKTAIKEANAAGADVPFCAVVDNLSAVVK